MDYLHNANINTGTSWRTDLATKIADARSKAEFYEAEAHRLEAVRDAHEAAEGVLKGAGK